VRIQAFSLAMVLAGAALADGAKPKAPKPAGPCATPRAAAHTFLDNLQPDQMRTEVAVRCFEAGGLDDAELVRRVKDLKAVLDARGLWVIMEDLPDTAEHNDHRGRPRIRLVAGFDQIELRRSGDEWRFPAEVVQRVPRLYRETFSGWVDVALNHLPSFFRARIFNYELWQIFGLFLLLMLASLVSRLVRAVVRGRLVGLLGRLKVESPKELLADTARPLGWLAAAGFIAALLPELRFSVGTARVLSVAIRLVAAVASVLVTYRTVDLLAMWMERRAGETAGRMDDQLVLLVRKALKTLVVAVGVVFVLQNLQVDVTSLLAGLGIGGLALALAAKDTAANIFGSFTIFVDVPFYVGDWIAAAGVEGTVMEIGLRSTRIRTFYDSVVSVPNSSLANSNIDNYSRRTYRRYSTRLTISYASTPDQIEAFVEGVRAIIAAHPDTRKDAYEVHFVEFGASALEVMVYTFFKVGTWTEELVAKQQLNLEFMRLAAELGVEFAFPTRTLHIESQVQPSAPRAAVSPDAEALTALVQGFGPGGTRSQPRGRGFTHGYFAGRDSARGDTDEAEG